MNILNIKWDNPNAKYKALGKTFHSNGTDLVDQMGKSILDTVSVKELSEINFTKIQEPIKVERTIQIVTEMCNVGDVISFELTDGEPVKAMAVKETSDGMLFIFVDCIKEEKPMVDDEDDEEVPYKDTDMRTYLNADLLERFPEEIRERMLPMEYGDYLRLATEKEIFGVNKYGADESDSVQQFEPMKLRRNRIAFEGDNGSFQWWWLKTKHKNSIYTFAYVNGDGNAYHSYASYSDGVRPVFLLS